MLISHGSRFIFVKTKKSAGSSVEVSLARFCDGPRDVITPLLPHDRRFQKVVGVQAKNHCGEIDGVRFQGHMPASKIQESVGETAWSTYTTFCVVRNPWSRVVSQYCFRRATQPNPPSSFEQFVRDRKFTVELPLYCRKGEVLVDQVLRFEGLQEEMWRITRVLGIDWDGWLPHTNTGFSPTNRHYSEAYTQELADIVARKCAREIDLHGYRFDGHPLGAGEALDPWTMRRDDGPRVHDRLVVRDEPEWQTNVVAENYSRPTRDGAIEQEDLPNLTLLQCSPDDQEFALNEPARDIWSLCDGRNTVADIFNALKDKYEVSDGDLSTELLLTLQRFEHSGLIAAPGLLEFDSRGRQHLNMRRIKFYVISCAGDGERREFMQDQLVKRGLDFEFIPGVRCKPKSIGVALSHLKILNMPEAVTPFAILEDDCQFTSALRYQYDVPMETDAFYLGISHFGSRDPGVLSRAKWNKVRFVPFEDEYLRVFNMFARHAIVYVSEAFRQATAKSTILGLTQRGRIFPGDATYAMLHTSHLVLTPHHPPCYQSRTFGGAERATRPSLSLPEANPA